MTDDQHKVGFVGFGAMARRMAARLRDASYSVIAFDVAQLSGELDGFSLVASPGILTQQVDAILVCVPDDHALQSSMQGEGGVLGNRSRG